MKELTGPIIMLSATIAYALLSPLLKKANQSMPPFTVMTISMFALFTVSLILSLTFEKVINLDYISAHKNTVLMLLGVGLINALSFWLIILAFKYMPIWQLTMFNLLAPVLAGIFAYFILGETMSLKLFLGLAIMSFGLFIAIR